MIHTITSFHFISFHFLIPKERDLHCSHEVILRTKQSNTYTYYKFIQHHYTLKAPERQPHHRYQNTNSEYTSPFFLIFTYCKKDTNLQGTLRNYDLILCPLTKLLNVDESRPLIVPHEFLQPVEVPILDFIYNTRHNHKLYNLIQNTLYKQSPNTEEHNIIKALELFWPLLLTKHIFRLLAKLLISSDIIHDVFPMASLPTIR